MNVVDRGFVSILLLVSLCSLCLCGSNFFRSGLPEPLLFVESRSAVTMSGQVAGDAAVEFCTASDLMQCRDAGFAGSCRAIAVAAGGPSRSACGGLLGSPLVQHFRAGIRTGGRRTRLAWSLFLLLAAAVLGTLL